MWIKTERDTLVRLKTPEIDTIVEFSGENTAQVTESVGEQLVEQFDHISQT